MESLRKGLMISRGHQEVVDLLLEDGREIQITVVRRRSTEIGLHIVADRSIRVLRRELRAPVDPVSPPTESEARRIAAA